MLRGSVVQTKIQTGLCASISPKAPTSQFIRRPSSIPSPEGSTPDHVKNSASILHKRFTSLHLPTILLKLVVHFTLESALLKRPHSTIGREIDRNSVEESGSRRYAPHEAYTCCTKRRNRPAKKLSASPELWTEVQTLMKKNWSPEQAAGMLKRMYPDAPNKHVSHETIYAYIYAYPRCGLRADLIKLLRKSHKTRKPRARGKYRRGQLQNVTPIAERPKDVETRVVPGHWEGDLIKGKYNRSSVGTLVERTSRYVILVQLDDAKAPTVHQASCAK